MTALPFMFLLFPDGRLPSPRWRALGWAAVICGGLILVLLGVSPQPLVENIPASENPIGVPALRSVNAEPLFSVYLLVLLLSGISLFVRFHRARGEERQQLKWIGYGATLLVLSFVVEEVGTRRLTRWWTSWLSPRSAALSSSPSSSIACTTSTG
jgi:hypothetical protein